MEDQGKKVGGSPVCQERRKVIKNLSAGVSVIVGCNLLPDKWITPIVGQLTLPAHATTSGPVSEEISATLQTVEEYNTTLQTVEEYNTKEEYSLRSFSGNNKRYTWLNETGAKYGGQIKFVFSNDCGELIVPDAKVTHGADGDSNNHDQAFYFCGTDFPKGSKENNGNRASVFAPPGCPAATVVLHYNKQ